MSNYSMYVPCNCTECGSIFENSFRLSEHLIKIHQRSIDVLPSHVIDEILGYVSPSDLAALNQLSRGLKFATERHVEDKRRHCGTVKIFSVFRNSIYLIEADSESNYENTFKFLIPNIKIELYDRNYVNSVFELIREKCPQQLRSLEIYGFWGETKFIHENDIGIIAEQIKHVQILKIGEGIQLAFQFQRFCNLQALFIEYLKTNVNRSFWNQKLPKLNILSIGENEDDHVDLKQFLKNNKQLKVFYDKRFNSLPNLLPIEDSLPIVSIDVDLDDITFDEFRTDFEECCNRKMIIPFVDVSIIGIENTSLQRMLQLTNVKSLHLTIEDETTFNQDFNIQPHVEQLCLISKIPISMAKITTIFSCFPNLSIIRISCNKKPSNMSHQEVIAVLVNNLPILKHIYYSTWLEFDLQEWDHLRTNAKNNSTVTIHLVKPKKSFPGSDIKIYSLQRKLAAVKFEDSVECTRCFQYENTNAMMDYFNVLISKQY